MVKTYRPKRLVDGSVIGYTGRFVAIPDKGYKSSQVKVIFEGKEMLIKNWHKAKSFRRFHDKFGGKDYTLAYHEFKEGVE